MRFNKYHKQVLKKAIVALENEAGDVFMDIMDDPNTLTAYEQLRVYAYTSADDPEDTTTQRRTTLRIARQPTNYGGYPKAEPRYSREEPKKSLLQILLEKCLAPKEIKETKEETK